MRQMRTNCLWTRRRGQGHVHRRGAGCRFGACLNQPAGVPPPLATLEGMHEVPRKGTRTLGVSADLREGLALAGSRGSAGNDAPRAALQRMQSGAGHASVRVCVCDCIYVSALPCLSVRSCLRARLLEQRRVVQLNHTLAHGGARQKF
jgi:hypothetical protein